MSRRSSPRSQDKNVVLKERLFRSEAQCRALQVELTDSYALEKVRHTIAELESDTREFQKKIQGFKGPSEKTPNGPAEVLSETSVQGVDDVDSPLTTKEALEKARHTIAELESDIREFQKEIADLRRQLSGAATSEAENTQLRILRDREQQNICGLQQELESAHNVTKLMAQDIAEAKIKNVEDEYDYYRGEHEKLT